MKKVDVKRIKDKFIDLKSDYPVLLFFIISNFINAILLRLFTIGGFGYRSIFFDFGYIILFASFLFLIKKKYRNILYIGATTFMVACCIVNAIYYNYYASFASASLLATSVFVKDVGDTVLGFAIKPTDWIYLWSLIGIIIIIKKNNENFYVNKKRFYNLFLLFFCSFALGCTLPPYNSFSRFFKLWNRVAVFDDFGIYVYQTDDLIQSLKPTFNNLFGYDAAFRKTKEYFDNNKSIQSVNEYTGIFEGKNVIVIHAESLQTFNLGLSFEGKEVTPNINKLAKEGIYFSNFYAQVGVGTSSDSEFTFSTSLLPANNGTVFVNYFNNKFETIQNLMNNKGYYVFSMHGNDGDFWNRNTMHLNMGYDKFYSKDSFIIDEEYGLGLSDKSFFRQAVEKIKEIDDNLDVPYYGTLITLTNHTPWSDVSFSDYKVTKTLEIDDNLVTRDYLEGTVLGRYIKSVNYMDSAIGQFIEDMDKEGLLDNTVIVIYGDHDARLPKSQYDYMYNYDPITDRLLDETMAGYNEFNEYDYELNRKVPFIIWTKEMNKGVNIDIPMGMVDAGVTLENMLNVYNKYALGHDAMDLKKEDAIVVFKDGSFVTDRIYYCAKNNEVYALASGVISDMNIDNSIKYADDILKVSDNIITYDLIKDLK